MSAESEPADSRRPFIVHSVVGLGAGLLAIEQGVLTRASPLIESVLINDSSLDDLRCLTEDLSSQDRLIIVLYYHEELTMAEIADMLDLTAKEISETLATIVAKRRQQMRDHGNSAA